MSHTVRQWRLMKEISQQSVADALGIHVNTYRKLEENPNRITIEEAHKISALFGVPMDKIDFSLSKTLQNV